MSGFFSASAVRLLTTAYGTTPNKMTPKILSCLLLAPDVAAEVSEGVGPEGEPVFGVMIAIRRKDGTAARTAESPDAPCLSGVFASRSEADAHVANVVRYLLRNAAAPEAASTRR